MLCIDFRNSTTTEGLLKCERLANILDRERLHLMIYTEYTVYKDTLTWFRNMARPQLTTQNEKNWLVANCEKYCTFGSTQQNSFWNILCQTWSTCNITFV